MSSDVDDEYSEIKESPFVEGAMFYDKYRRTNSSTERQKLADGETFTIPPNKSGVIYQLEVSDDGILKIHTETQEGDKSGIGVVSESNYFEGKKNGDLDKREFVTKQILRSPEKTTDFSVISSGNYLLYTENIGNTPFVISFTIEYVRQEGIIKELIYDEQNKLTTSESLPSNTWTLILYLYMFISTPLFFTSAWTLVGVVAVLMNPVLLTLDTYSSRKDGPFPQSEWGFRLYQVCSALPIGGHLVVIVFLIQRRRSKCYPQTFRKYNWVNDKK